MPNIFFQISGLIHVIMILIVYLIKPKEKELKNKIFIALVSVAMSSLIFDILSVLLGVYTNNDFITSIMCKLHLSTILAWMIVFTYYLILMSSYDNDDETTSSLKIDFKSLSKKSLLLGIICVVVIWGLPLKIIQNGAKFYPLGPSVYFCYICFGICYIKWLYIMLKRKKRSDKNVFNSLLAFLAFAAVILILQILHPEYLLVSSVLAFVTILTYHSIENPDIYAIKALNIATQQAESANHAKSEFLSSVSHEIRTPLNAIVDFSQSLAKEEISGPAKDEVKEILNASTILLETINGILEVSKLEANKIQIINKDYSTKKLISEIANTANMRLGSKSVELKFEIDEKLPPVLNGDSVRIKEIIYNLISNSIKFTKEGYILLKIDSISANNKCLLTIIVEDTGIGMTEQDLEMLFVKFQKFEIDKNINISGTGLGMAITKGLVELMDGEIDVKSSYGKGTTFTILLEQEISNNELEFSEEYEIKLIEPFDASGQKVLVVDDNKINLRLAQNLLSKYKLDIELCESGRECINKIMNNEKYDLILLDMMMPKMKGSEVLDKLKKIPEFNTPVIALTADVIAGMEEKYISYGFKDCLPKPILEENLYNLLKNYLRDTRKDKNENKLNLSKQDSFKEDLTLPKLNKDVIKIDDIEPPQINLLSELIDLTNKKILIDLAEKSQILENNDNRTISNINTPTSVKKIMLKELENLKKSKNNKDFDSYAITANKIKLIAENNNYIDICKLAYEHELAGKTLYQEYINENFRILVNMINNIEE